MLPYTIHDFNRNFPTDDACLEALMRNVYPDGIDCRKCGEVRPHHRLKRRKAYSCDYCGTHVYPLAGTIFAKSRTSLKSWFYAMYLVASTRCGISAAQLQREVGTTYKTAWRMFFQIRTLLAEPIGNLSGGVEVDKSFFGGKEKNKHKSKRQHLGTGGVGKTAVLGILERKGRIVATVVPNTRAATLIPHVLKKVLPKSTVYTDEYGSYNLLEREGFEHKRVYRSQDVYVEGDAHVNTLEGF